MPTVDRQTYTPEDLLELPDGKYFELVGGELVETAMSLESAWVASQVTERLNAVVRGGDGGVVMTDSASYQCFPDAPSKVRRPDVSYIRRGRLAPAQFQFGHCTIHPDLAVEVVSPNDLYYEVEIKVDEYLSAGVSLVWVINPGLRYVRVFTPDGGIRQLEGDDELTGGDIIPDFCVCVSDLFPPADLSQML